MSGSQLKTVTNIARFRYSDEICRAIMTEIRQRRRPKVKRGLLEKDVLTQLTNHVGQRYDANLTLCIVRM